MRVVVFFFLSCCLMAMVKCTSYSNSLTNAMTNMYLPITFVYRYFYMMHIHRSCWILLEPSALRRRLIDARNVLGPRESVFMIWFRRYNSPYLRGISGRCPASIRT